MLVMEQATEINGFAQCAADSRDAFAAVRLAGFLKQYISGYDYAIMCVGSDKALEDCLGPLCGSLLENKIPLPVIGTLSHPVHAENISYTLDKLSLIYPDRKIIIVDAAASEIYDIGTVVALTHGLYINGRRTAGTVGALSIVGITRSESAEVSSYNKAGLSRVGSMSLAAAAVIKNIFT